MKLEVGDIRMDSSKGISFGESSGDAEPRPIEPPRSFLAHIPPIAFAAAALLAAVCTAGLVVAGVVYGAWVLFAPVYFTGRFAIYAGLIAVGPHKAERPDQPSIADVRAVVANLESRPDVTADDLQAALGWSERRTVAALAEGVRRDAVDEDLDLRSGEWRYRPTTVLDSGPARATLTAEDRLQAIDERVTKTEAQHRSNT